MILIGGPDIATSILVIPCDKQPLFNLNIRPIPEGKHAILYGNFATQHAFARKCICNQTPCKGIVTKDWLDDKYNSAVPMGPTYEIHKKDCELAKELIKTAYGNVSIVAEAIQEQTNKLLK